MAAHALTQGNEVYVIDAMVGPGSYKNRAWLDSMATKGQLEIAEIAVENADAVNGFFKEYGPFHHIAHMAGQVAVTTSLSSPRRDFLANAVGTFNLLEATRLHSPEAMLIYASTNKVYGDLREIRLEESERRYLAPDYPEGFDESLPLHFATPYGCSKGAADQYVRDWSQSFGLKTIVFRQSAVYGKRQFPTFDQGWVSWLCLKAVDQSRALREHRRAEPLIVSGTGKQVRDVLHVDDLIELYDLAFANGEACVGSAFNVGGGMENSFSLLELIEQLGYRLGIELRRNHVAWRIADQKFFVAHLDRVQSAFGWFPRISARWGIDAQLEWAATGLASESLGECV
jgi:CDP-paratose 2-epimerase